LSIFICTLDVLEHHRVTVDLKKARFIPERAEFVGVDIFKEGNSTDRSSHAQEQSYSKPVTQKKKKERLRSDSHNTKTEARTTKFRRKLELLSFNFTIVHRPGKMRTEGDTLSRYNTWTSQWRVQHEKEQAEKAQTERQTEATEATQNTTATTLFTQEELDTGITTYDRWSIDYERQLANNGDISWNSYEAEVNRFCNDKEPSPVPTSHVNPRTVGPKVAIRTPTAETWDMARTMWIIGAGEETATTATEELGLTPLVTRK
jgi:hypothetical protein